MLVFFFWDLDSWNDFRERLRLFFRPVHLLIFLIAFLLIFLPQMLYWKYLYGSYMVYTYAGEGFTNWTNPKIPEIFFSTLNGLFLYSPLVSLMLAGIIFMIIKKQKNGILIAVLFIILSYVIASWYNWYYGCSFGQRSYVEFYTILSVPLGSLFKAIFEMRRRILIILILPMILILCYFSVRMSFAYNKCFFGSTWDWPEYSMLLGDAGFGSNKGKPIIHTNDFENFSLAGESILSTEAHHSGMYSAKAIPEKSTSWLYWVYFRDIPDSNISRVNATLWFLNKQPFPTGAMLVFSVEKDGKALDWQAEPLEEKGKGIWTRQEAEFRIPSEIDDSTLVKLYIWNKEKSTFFVDDVQFKFK
jgi:hypothetical protein